MLMRPVHMSQISFPFSRLMHSLFCMKKAPLMRPRDQCDSLQVTRVCREPEQCAACSATADAASERAIATFGGTEDVLPCDLVVVERPFSRSCLALV
ncbi:hypothetical protein M513_12251 [Trichuris suis]|uniref:Uncharacterized protein n=1 Tax=Trichuris suis TaxID=68888 RepID=A0A085LPJ7_9BILA|nr:hypothetical protein M513_12251 [Trichuris suis]